MTTDATRNNAEQWHMPPQAPRLGEGMAPLPPVSWSFTGPVPILDLSPLIAHFEKELSRLRDQLAVERGTAASAREALAACEERLRSSGNAYDAATIRRQAETIGAYQEENRALRAQLEQAKTVPSGLVPGSVEAVLEAYRLLKGHAPHRDCREWFDRADGARSSGDENIDEASCALLYWLDQHAPGGRP